MTTSTVSDQVRAAVADAAAAAKTASGALANASDRTIDAALSAMAGLLGENAEVILAANREDYASAEADGMGGGLLDRLRIDAARLQGMADQLRVLAETANEPAAKVLRKLGDGNLVIEKRRPIGVLGANFEARPNVTLDMASQCLKSRNAVVLRTGSAALATATALVEAVIAPGLRSVGLPEDAVQLLQVRDRASAEALVQHPEGIPLVILRGSGDSTRSLARLAALAGVRTLAHADGGGVLYVHPSADLTTLDSLIDAGVDRLGVCNRLNLLLIDSACWNDVLPRIRERLAARTPSISVSEPPHAHALGYEWALDDEHAATITVSRVSGATEAAAVANRETSGLAATIVAEDVIAAGQFLGAYAGTGGFWNATTRLLDGYKLLALPETGINVDRLPGPRGPVTFRDLYVRQYIVGPPSVEQLVSGI